MWNIRQQKGAFRLQPCQQILIGLPCLVWEVSAHGISHDLSENRGESLETVIVFRQNLQPVMDGIIEVINTEKGIDSPEGQSAVFNKVQHFLYWAFFPLKTGEDPEDMQIFCLPGACPDF